MEPQTWLTLGYQVPAEPSKNRVYVWRKLKEFGAVYFRAGVALLPRSELNLTRFVKLSKRVEAMGGESTLAELRFLYKQDEINTVKEFTRRSQQEYQDLLLDISALRAEKPREAARVKQSARQIARRLRQVHARDYFMSRRVPEISNAFNDLFTDMSRATDALSNHLLHVIQEKEK